MEMVDWKRILRRGYESKDLDYKGPCSWDEENKDACCEIVKDIMAMANTDGGWLVIGVEETDKGFDWKGLPAEQAGTYDTTRINRFVQRYADPPINAETVKIEDEGKTFVIIVVPRFNNTPHICRKEFPKRLDRATIYVRTDNNESAPIEEPADFSKIVETAIRNRSDQLLESFRRILEKGESKPEPDNIQKFEAQIKECRQKWALKAPKKKDDYAYVETMFIPTSFKIDRYPLEVLKDMSKNGGVDYRGWPFMYVNLYNPEQTYVISDGYETVLINDGDKHVHHFWQLRQSGLLYVKQACLDVRANPWKQDETILSFDGFCMNMAEAVNCLTKLYDGCLDEDEEIELRLNLLNIQGLPLGSANTARLFLPVQHVCQSPEINYRRRASLLDWKTAFVDHALDMCKFVLQRFNWETPNLFEARKLIEDMLQRNPHRY